MSLVSEISRRIKKDTQACEDLYLLLQKDMTPASIRQMKELSQVVADHIGKGTDVRKMYQLHFRVLKALAPYDFESYLLAMEWRREEKDKFYPPRRKQLKPIVDALQRLEDGSIDILGISMPPGTGKTTLALFYMTWIAGRRPDESILGISHNSAFLKGVYNEVMRLLTEDTYTWSEIFTTRLCGTNAKDMRIDLGERKRFETFQFASIEAGKAGVVRCSHLLYCDDLVDGIETAMSLDRLDTLYQKYTADARQRKIGDCKELHISTRWSVHDILGRLERQYMDDERALFLSFPALDENDESNFDYDCKARFTTEFYHEQREVMDDVSWKCLYMNEPIEREGLLYEESELRRYFTLPEEIDTVIAVCDAKDTGPDYCVVPIAYVSGDDYYIEDILCDNGKIEVVDGRVVDILYRHDVRECQIESNNAGRRFANDVQSHLKERGGNTHITKKFTTKNKETKIQVNSAWVKEHCLFKEDGDKEYKKALKFLCSYSMEGKNKHDDVPDAFAMLSEYARHSKGTKVEIVRRFI